MSTEHNILSQIPHENIQSEFVKADERFDVFKLGIFKVTNSLLSVIGDESIYPVDEIVELVKLQASARYRPHYHHYSCAVIYMIIGEGDLLLANEKIPYQPGMRIDIPKNTPHGFLTNSETLFLSIQTPPIRNRQTGEVDLHYVEDSN